MEVLNINGFDLINIRKGRLNGKECVCYLDKTFHIISPMTLETCIYSSLKVLDNLLIHSYRRNVAHVSTEFTTLRIWFSELYLLDIPQKKKLRGFRPKKWTEHSNPRHMLKKLCESVQLHVSHLLVPKPFDCENLCLKVILNLRNWESWGFPSPGWSPDEALAGELSEASFLKKWTSKPALLIHFGVKLGPVTCQLECVNPLSKKMLQFFVHLSLKKCCISFPP